VIDFFTQSDSPVEIKIDGTTYKLPRFLLRHMIKYSATLRRQQVETATAHLSPDDKARFLTYFQPPAIDLMEMARWCLSAEGVLAVCEAQLKAANVPDELRKSLLNNGDPQTLYALAAELTTAVRAKAQLGSMNQGGDNPLTQPPPESGNSAAAPPATNTTSAPPTPDSTRAA
jgi:hypothetical protein